MSNCFMSEKLQKVLVCIGLGLCCELEIWIVDGWVFVNGQVVMLGDCVELEDIIRVDGRII